MNVVVALDSFKGSLGSRAAGEAVREGVLRMAPDAHVALVEIADGGEGSADVLRHQRGGREVMAISVDALGRRCDSSYVVLDQPEGSLAVVESARTIGLARVGPVDATTAIRASSFGLGAQLAQVVADGHRRILVTLGGTATTDGGAGLLMALGARLLDADGVEIGREGNPLWRFDTLDAALPRFAEIAIDVLVDVDNPLLGERGAAAVFGPQKGATPGQVRDLEIRMGRWAEALAGSAGFDVAAVPGSGAAGGCAAALLAVGGRLEPGFARLAREIGLPGLIEGADLVFTGEGSLDAQTAMGKAPAGVARLAREAGAMVVALAGRVDPEALELTDVFDAMFCIHREGVAAELALDPGVTFAGLAATAAEVTGRFLESRG